jgi:purine-nucleoside phosphorylase
MGALAEEVQGESMPFAVIPYFPQPTVEGHSGELVLGRLAEKPVAVLRGRVHMYEGGTPDETAFPIRMLRALGCDTLIVTNAAGGLNPDYRPGDLMLINDHIFLAGMSGLSPLMGPHDPQFGPRFVDMGQAYDPRLRELAWATAHAHEISLREGIYVMLAGPHFETPAEVRLLRALGGDAVGMSTCPEVVVARQVGMRVMGISTITNAAAGHVQGAINHLEILRVAEEASRRLLAIVAGTLAQLDL